ncbi:hypothetical protein SAY87_000104 [Trapa incisa]|uniref:Rhamnogalacturonate lyase n=1 Tax=Trapa incisa TaxID=236973 RepID=A0AAN7JGX2_9MYRT|nr:hypothetical protein SAY87_000104 [Trapa incisa]
MGLCSSKKLQAGALSPQKLRVRKPPRDKSAQGMSSPPVKLLIQDRHVVVDNGIVQVTLSEPDGIVTGIRYNGIDNLLEIRNQEHNRGYWDLVWSVPGSKGIFDVYEAFLLSRPAIFSALRKSYLLFPLFSFSLSSQNILLLQ